MRAEVLDQKFQAFSQRMKDRFKPLLSAPLHYTSVRRGLEMIPYLGARLPAWHRTHPFDRQYGTDTSGVLSAQRIVTDKTPASEICPYTGSQPSIIRRAIAALGETDKFHFVDLGCGKGRAMIVATEFPFRSIRGVELSSRLARIARRNLARVGRCFPARPPVAVVEGNAITFPLPEGKIALFLYHPFGLELLSHLIIEMESFLSRGNGPLYLIYYNPVHGDVLDASPAFTRWYADTLPYDDSELGFGPDTEDNVVIWRSINGEAATPHPHADRPIIITKPKLRAELAESCGTHTLPAQGQLMSPNN
ncbi:MAG TPA: class I SAM-dependent methyltransferase [Verrucomicrobiae bacterium]|nr:class I SAM-dependent methyltransferase [Verrucomicrobiae bacterium]